MWKEKRSDILPHIPKNLRQRQMDRDPRKGIAAVREKDPVKRFRALVTERLHIDLRKNPIEVRLEGDVMVIEGMVEDIARKKRALLIAMGLEGVSGVADRLRVRQSSTMTDEEIKRHTEDAFSGEPTLKGCDITLEVNGGVVDIEGTVPSLTHKRLAGVLAWWVPGSMDVINSLEVEPPEEDSDDEVSDAVRIALEKDRLVDASVLRVSTSDWVVTLDGVLSSEPEKDAAGQDAWYVWGVNEVINNIRVR